MAAEGERANVEHADSFSTDDQNLAIQYQRPPRREIQYQYCYTYPEGGNQYIRVNGVRRAYRLNLFVRQHPQMFMGYDVDFEVWRISGRCVHRNDQCEHLHKIRGAMKQRFEVTRVGTKYNVHVKEFEHPLQFTFKLAVNDGTYGSPSELICAITSWGQTLPQDRQLATDVANQLIGQYASIIDAETEPAERKKELEVDAHECSLPDVLQLISTEMLSEAKQRMEEICINGEKANVEHDDSSSTEDQNLATQSQSRPYGEVQYQYCCPYPEGGNQNIGVNGMRRAYRLNLFVRQHPQMFMGYDVDFKVWRISGRCVHRDDQCEHMQKIRGAMKQRFEVTQIGEEFSVNVKEFERPMQFNFKLAVKDGEYDSPSELICPITSWGATLPQDRQLATDVADQLIGEYARIIDAETVHAKRTKQLEVDGRKYAHEDVLPLIRTEMLSEAVQRMKEICIN